MPSIAIPVSLRGQLLNSVRAVTAFSPSTLFALNEPGVWYDPSDVANLAWRRNLLVNSENFNTTTWTTRLADATLTQGITDPLGGNSAATLTSTGALGRTSFSPGFTLASGTQVATSVWLRRRTGTGTVSIYDSGVSQSAATTVTLTSDWQRFSVAKTISYTGTQTPGIVLGTNGDAVDMWGFQFELGSVATDYQRISNVNTEVIERFPSATLYQDAIGTIPVTTPGDPVGLALDKSKGLVLGSELVTNGTFDSGTTGWTSATGTNVSGTLAASGGLLTLTVTGTTAGAVYQGVTTVVGRTYKVETIISSTSGTAGSAVVVRKMDNTNILSATNDVVFLSGVSPLSNFTVTGYFVATATTSNIFVQRNSAGNSITIDNISVKELPGFHATQATLASRPTYGVVPLGGRRNLLTRTEEFGTSPWTNTTAGTGVAPTVTADAGNDPNGTATADRIQFSLGGGTASGDISRRVQSFTTPAALHVFSVYIRSTDGASNYNMHIVGSDGLTTNIVVTGAWQRFSVAATGSGAPVSYAIGLRGGQTPSNSNTADILAWGAQLETGSTATAYQRVGSAFDVTEAGVASLSYLSFDGVDDSLVTPTITPGIDKAQVFAGVRKLSDATAGIIVESSATVETNNGSVIAFTNPNTYGAKLRGSLNPSAVTAPTSYAVPITNVLTAIGDIAGDLNTLRINGTQQATASSDQGTGNFLAYPLYIGRRAGASLPFNGNLFSLIVRFGTNLDAGTITSTETWVNGKTGAYA